MLLKINAADKASTTKSLGKRLSAIDRMISTGYDHIWDCCCDHGLLGIHLLRRNAAPYIHFVDVTPQLIDDLEDKLRTFFAQPPPPNSQWLTHCQDAHDIPISKVEGQHLMVIAGVGGDLARDIVQSLISEVNSNKADQSIDFLLCPVRQHYSLRQSLKAQGCRLKKELLVEENKRIYEVILCTYARNQADSDAEALPLVCETGDEIWHAIDMQQVKLARRYLDLLVKHYSRMTASGSRDAEQMLKAYESIEISRLI